MHLWLLLASVCWARKLAGSFTVHPTEKDDRVHYIAKFACDIGECKYHVRAGIKQPLTVLHQATNLPFENIATLVNENYATARVVVRVVLDDDWDSSHSLTPCKRAELGRGRTTLSFPLNGTMGPWSTNTFRQSHRPHFWYFFAEDCRNSITGQLAKLAGVNPVAFSPYELNFEIEMLQVGGGHLSFEYTGMLKYCLLQVVVYIGLLVWMYWKQVRVMKNQRFQLHLMTQILNASCLCTLVSAAANVVNLWKVDQTGSTFPLLESLADGASTLAHIAVSSCLVLIALGVTLNAPQRMSVFVLRCLGALIAVAHVAVVIVDKYTSDPRYKYYGSEGPIGWILVVFRLALWALFLLCWHATQNDPRTPGATERFLRRTVVPSSAYFLAFPILVALTSCFRPYQRHAFLYHGSFVVQTVAVFWLSEVFLSKGEYFKVSQMSQSFLPGGVWRPSVSPHHID